MPPLHFFQGNCSAYQFGKRRGRLNIHFAPFDFYKSHLTIRLIQKICENVEIYDILKIYIMIKHVIVK
jgi:hypothetical protein